MPKEELTLTEALKQLDTLAEKDKIYAPAINKVYEMVRTLEGWMSDHISDYDCYPEYFMRFGYSKEEAEEFCES